jgi:hypothetical protein
LPDFAKNRAEVIAETEVGNLVEGTRETMYKEEGYAWKAWQSVGDERVRPDHVRNEAEGWIAINEAFVGGEMRGGEAVRCRCTTLYSRDRP